MTDKNENTQKILKMIKELVELLGTTLATDIKDLTPPRDLKAGDEAMSYAQQNPAPREYKTPFVESRPINPPGTPLANVRNVSTCTAYGGDSKGGLNELVNIRGERLFNDYAVRGKAEATDQSDYLKDLAMVLTVKQLEAIQALALKSNQQHTPALWLNQTVAIELTASSVFSLIKPASRITEARTNVQEARDGKETEAIKRILGTILFEKLRWIAEACELAAPALFFVIVEKVIADRQFKPASTVDMWKAAKEIAKSDYVEENIESAPSPSAPKPKRVRKSAPKKAASRKAAQKAPPKKLMPSYSEAVAQAQRALKDAAKKPPRRKR